MQEATRFKRGKGCDFRGSKIERRKSYSFLDWIAAEGWTGIEGMGRNWWRRNRQWGGVETPLTKTPQKVPPSCESSSPELASAPRAKSPGTRHSKKQLAIPATSLRIRPFAAACCSRIHVRDAAPPHVLTSSRPEHQIAAHAGTPAAIGGCGFGA